MHGIVAQSELCKLQIHAVVGVLYMLTITV